MVVSTIIYISGVIFVDTFWSNSSQHHFEEKFLQFFCWSRRDIFLIPYLNIVTHRQADSI